MLEIKKRIQEKQKGHRWPTDLKKEILNIGFQLKKEGWHWCNIAKELGCSREMLFEWKRKEMEKEQDGFALVIHKENIEDSQSFVLSSTQGFEIKGLMLEQAIFAMRALHCFK